nr:hypothetical protein CFP56_16634 [Quercus suber]
MSCAFSRNAWRDMLSPYLRMRPLFFLSPVTRLRPSISSILAQTHPAAIDSPAARTLAIGAWVRVEDRVMRHFLGNWAYLDVRMHFTIKVTWSRALRISSATPKHQPEVATAMAGK